MAFDAMGPNRWELIYKPLTPGQHQEVDKRILECDNKV
jgi:hypothetical protein